MSAPLHVRIVVLFSVISSTTKFISAASTPDAKVLTLVCYNHDVITAAVSASNGKRMLSFSIHFSISSFFIVVVHMRYYLLFSGVFLLGNFLCLTSFITFQFFILLENRAVWILRSSALLVAETGFEPASN